MPKRKKSTKRKPSANVAAIEAVAPTPEQIMKGEAVRDFVTHAESATKAMAHRVAHDPVEKWRRKGYFNTVEMNTITRMQEVWQRVYGELKVTGSLCEAVQSGNAGFSGTPSQEREIVLREALRDAEALFSGAARAYFVVFERICRFGEHPMDVVGDRQDALRTVKFVANMLAARRIV